MSPLTTSPAACRAPQVLLAVALLLGACGDAPDPPPEPPPTPPKMSEAMPDVLLPPGAELLSRSGGSDAIQLTLRSDQDAARVADYYRGVLTRGEWRLVSDVTSQDGAITLYAEQDGPPLWVRVWSDSGQAGSMVQLAGAVVRRDSLEGGARDSGKASRPESSTPSNRATAGPA
jgi:hypothetical protein